MGELTAECAYCSQKASPRFMICPQCWQRCPAEIHDHVRSAMREHGPDSKEFDWAVKFALHFLMWLDEDDDATQGA